MTCWRILKKLLIYGSHACIISFSKAKVGPWEKYNIEMEYVGLISFITIIYSLSQNVR